MATPDVRVRLSAEGVAEVVGALKKVQAEGDKAAAKQSRGFTGLNKILGSTTSLLGGLSIALGVRQFQQWIQSSIRGADGIQKLGQRVGASTENLSALHLIARTSASSLEEMSAALAKQNKYIGEAARGNPKAVATFRDLGLSLRDFKGKDSVQIFELIAKKISALPSPIEKTKVAMDIFGRAGANLIPTMNALADEGLARVTERARELGVLIDTDLAEAARQMRDDFELLKAQSEGIGTRFAAGLAPQLSQALQMASGEVKETTDVWKSLGSGVGQIIKTIVGVETAGLDWVRTEFRGFSTDINALIKMFRGEKAFLEEASAEEAALIERLKTRWKLLTSKPPKPTSRPETPEGEELEDPAELAAKRAQAMQMTLDRELALVRSAASLRNAAEKRAFEEGLANVRDYYNGRRRVAEENFAKEIQILEKKRALLESEIDPARRLQEQGKIDVEVAKARLKQEEAMAALLFEEREAVQKLAQERLALEKTLLEAQGRRHEAALLGIDEEIRKTDLLLRKQGVSDAEREATLERLRRSLEASANFEEIKSQAEAALAELDGTLAEIDAKVSAGLLSQVEGEQQLLATEENRLEVLQALATALEEAALATGDPEKIGQAQAYAASIRDLGFAVEGARTSFADFGRTALDSGRDALAEFFDTGITGAKSLRDAFRNLALSVIADLRRMAAQLIATAIMKKIAGAFGGGGLVGGEGGEKKAEGGLLGGRGTGISDSNLAWFSRGEYLVRAAVVREPGVLRHLEDLNRRGIRALVQTPILIESSGGDGASMDGRLLIGLDEGLILRQLESSAGQRILVKTINKNRRGIRSALGI